MRKVLFLTCLVIASCAPKKVKTDGLIVIINQPEYQIGQVGDTKYIIHASSYPAAEKIAKEQLGCGKHICSIGTDGVILVVERPDANLPKK